jgi:hypothetical protein
MSVLLSLLLITIVAALVAAPLAVASRADIESAANPGRERLEREKTAALNAIREAQFDHAMGKLSEEDYASLRSFYERRALAALTELGAQPVVAELSPSCGTCGRDFTDDSEFCGGCGRSRLLSTF